MTPRATLACVVVLGAVSCLLAQPAHACCPAYPRGSRVAIADQEILIAYDAAAKREHFVRRAAFKSDTPEGFGFLVPTPTQPELAEAPGQVFGDLREAIKPKIEWVNDYSVTPAALCFCFLTLAPKHSAAPRAVGLVSDAVTVLDQASVAGYDAVVLEAKNADALITWLADNDYEARPELTDWVRPYVEAGWKVTAFKYAAKPGDAVSTKAIRMSFDTDTPLFPYRVPTDQIAPEGRGNLLRVYYVGAGRVDGALGSARAAWSAETKYAAEIAQPNLLLEGAVPGAAISAGLWLTAFEDWTWPSGTEDLYFAPAAENREFIPVEKRSKHVSVFVPFDIILLVVGGIGLWWYRKTKARAQA